MILTEKEKKMLDNLDVIPTAKQFGLLQVKTVQNPRYAFLNEIKKTESKKYCGTIQAITENRKTVWYFDAIDGETYRIPEPTEGIDSYFEIEFKRTDISGA